MLVRVVVVALVSFVGLGGCSKPDKAEVAHRMWVDHLPEDARENFTGVLIGGGNKVQVGAFHRGSAFAGQWELFTWRPGDGGRAELELLQTEKVHRVRVDMDACKVPDGFDYCMVWKGAPGGTKRWYSRARWYLPADTELEPQQIAPHLTQMMVEDLAASQ